MTAWDDALRVVRQRRSRRLIERSHDVLNSDGRIKRLQRETVERLQRALTVSGVVVRRCGGGLLACNGDGDSIYLDNPPLACYHFTRSWCRAGVAQWLERTTHNR